jgi:hypothetical protein
LRIFKKKEFFSKGKKIPTTGGTTIDYILMDNGATMNVDELKQESFLIKSENNSLRIRCKAMQDTIDSIRDKNIKLLADVDVNRIDNSKTSTNGFVQSYLAQIEDLRYIDFLRRPLNFTCMFFFVCLYSLDAS